MKNVGQMVITGISGKSLTAEEQKFLEKEDIGGVILFSHNYEHPTQVAELVNSIQKCRNEYPLFISVDHEGGRVQRFRTHFSLIPPMLKLSKLDSPKICFQIHALIAQELSACGINLNFAPCCDILTNEANKVIGDRAFGIDAESVGKFVTSAIRGLQTNGVIACAKHFPGHGNTSEDSHFDLPVVKTELKTIIERELDPFIKSVKARVEMVMMAHLVVNTIDPDLPTSLSPKAYKFLRDQIKHQRLILTDDMQMKAVADHFTIPDAAVRAIGAGADMLIYRDIGNAMIAVEALHEAAKTKRLTNKLLEEKALRIEECKKSYFAEYSPIYIPDVMKRVGTRESQELLKDIKRQIDLLG